ncbi:YihY/virulence factor BrkB family protein [Roseicella aerolata]|uniref:YihY/virulence factor BrkB family protein n=1 Tax=Roseicella aerolata TaxID=2883479 RepID=A0A9X1LCV1_9PROT|nr:YihY/virulence factor BrkB family protein [Roseicella aerolata]MCB4824438.1 YihY/virulence factor BrkB family protein [Roseicella aerolata]
MFGRFWSLIRESVEDFIEDDAMSRGAAIAYYTIFSIAPLLVIATAIAGLFFGEDAVQGAIAAQLRDLVGERSAEAVQAMVRGASNRTSGTIATLIGVVTLLFTASGVFVELQSALNLIWRAPTPPGDTVTRLVKARIASLGLVAATGFLLLVSLLASAALSAFATWFGGLLPEMRLILAGLNFLISFATISALFAAIYKILPNRPLAWRDVAVGAVVTAFLFTVGKSLIGWYIGSSTIASAYGAAGSLMVVLLWVYYSAQVFLLGAEFTKVWAGMKGSEEARKALEAEPLIPSRSRRQRREGERKSAAPSLGAAALTAVALTMLKRRR